MGCLVLNFLDCGLSKKGSVVNDLMLQMVFVTQAGSKAWEL